MIRPLTSASNLHRRKLCPGSARLEAQCDPEKESGESAEGTLMHAYMAGTASYSPFLDEEKWCLDFCQGHIDRITDEIFPNNEFQTEKEVTLSFDDKEFGHADFIRYGNTKAMVVDYKFGRLPVDPAEANMQLRAYAVMVADTYLCRYVYCFILQPRAEEDDRITATVYGTDDIEKARAEIREILKTCDKPDAPLNPGMEQCRYCRAKSTCPALNQQLEEITIVDQNAITSQNAADLYRRAKLVEKHIDAIKSKIFLMVQNAEAENRKIPGLTLKPGTKRRIVNDTSQAYQSLAHVLTPQAFASCCTVKISDLDAAYKSATGKTAKEAKAELEAILASVGCLEMKHSEPSLVLTKE